MSQAKRRFAILTPIAFFSFPLLTRAQAYLESASGADLPGGSIYSVIAGTMDWLLAILGFIAIIGFVIAGILYLTAAGNDGQIKTAKEAMKWSIVGVIVALMGYVILQAADLWLNAGTQF